MRFIDTHVHFWDPNHLKYSWLDDAPAIKRVFLPADVPSQSVDAIVFVEADCAPEQSVAETAWVTSLAAQDKRIQGIVAAVALEHGDGARPTLEQLKAYPLVKSIRRLIQAEGPGFSIQPAFVAGVRLVAQYGYSFDICIKHHQLADILTLVKQCPQVSFVLDHIGKPDIKNGLLDPWRAQIKELAAFPNVACKLSGMVTEADTQNWQPADLRPYIDHTLNVFGIDRVMFGSDWPVVNLAGGYERWFNTLMEAVAGLSEGEKQKLFVENGKRFYRL